MAQRRKGLTESELSTLASRVDAVRQRMGLSSTSVSYSRDLPLSASGVNLNYPLVKDIPEGVDAEELFREMSRIRGPGSATIAAAQSMDPSRFSERVNVGLAPHVPSQRTGRELRSLFTQERDIREDPEALAALNKSRRVKILPLAPQGRPRTVALSPNRSEAAFETGRVIGMVASDDGLRLPLRRASFLASEAAKAGTGRTIPPAAIERAGLQWLVDNYPALRLRVSTIDRSRYTPGTLLNERMVAAARERARDPSGALGRVRYDRAGLPTLLDDFLVAIGGAGARPPGPSAEPVTDPSDIASLLEEGVSSENIPSARGTLEQQRDPSLFGSRTGSAGMHVTGPKTNQNYVTDERGKPVVVDPKASVYLQSLESDYVLSRLWRDPSRVSDLDLIVGETGKDAIVSRLEAYARRKGAPLPAHLAQWAKSPGGGETGIELALQTARQLMRRGKGGTLGLALAAALLPALGLILLHRDDQQAA